MALISIYVHRDDLKLIIHALEFSEDHCIQWSFDNLTDYVQLLLAPSEFDKIVNNYNSNKLLLSNHCPILW